MSFSIHALGLLLALASVVFAAQPASLAVRFVALPGGFVVTSLVLAGPTALNPALLGWLIAGLAALALFRPRWQTLAIAAAGMAAGAWSNYLQAQGLIPVLAVVVAAGPAVLSASLRSNRTSFAPAALNDEALTLICTLGIVVAAAPRLASGWASAAALNLGPSNTTPGPAIAGPSWIFPLLMLVTIAGVAFGSSRKPHA